LQQVPTHSSIRTTYDFLNPKAHDADEVTSYNLIDFQNCNPLGHSIAQQHLNAAHASGCTFIPVVLRYRASENIQRMCSSKRQDLVASGKGLLLDMTLMMEMRERGEIFRFGCEEELELDVTSLAPEIAARKIAAHVKLVMARL
jgi:hypothetical protein